MRAIVALFIVYVGFAAVLLAEPTRPTPRALVDASVAARPNGTLPSHATVLAEQPRITRTFSPITPLSTQHLKVVAARPNVEPGVSWWPQTATTPASERPASRLQTALSVVVQQPSATPDITSRPRARTHVSTGHTVAAILPVPLVVGPDANRATYLHASSESGPLTEGELAIELQQELKRVGCYLGEIDGIWGPGSRRAMTAFNERANAVLPVDKPDAILLRLVSAHTGAACGQSCPHGQALGGDGRCLPNAIIAQSTGQGRDVGARGRIQTASSETSLRAQRPARTSVVEGSAYRPASSTALPIAFAARNSTWASRLDPSSERTKTASTNGPQSRPPIPGRMAIGGPMTGVPGRAALEPSLNARQSPAPLAEDRRTRQARATRNARPSPQRRSSYTPTPRATRWTATFFGSNP